MNQSDYRLGYPPALLALDPEPRVSRETPPRPPACVDARSGAVIDRAETAALVPADCKQIKFNGAADRKVRLEADPPCEADLLRPAAPPSAPAQPAGVWVKTSHKHPPIGAHLVRTNASYLSVTGWSWIGDGWQREGVPTVMRHDWEWLDTSPQPDADGWIAWDLAACKGHEGPKNADEARLRCGEVRRASTLCSWGVGVANKNCEVVAYRTAK